MNFIEKRKVKRRATIGFIIAFSMMGLVTICAVLFMVLNLKENDISPFFGYLALVFLALCIVSGIIGQINLNKRYKYKQNIINWRQYTYFIKCLNALLHDDYVNAVKYHEYRLLKNKYLRDFLWGFGIHAFLTGNVKKRQEFAEGVIRNLKNDFNPDNIFK